MSHNIALQQVSVSKASRTRRLWVAVAGAVVAALAVVMLLDWRQSSIQEEQKRLSLIPHRFAVSKILYAEEKCSGFGLSGGDNCGGVIVYELPESNSREIQQDGLAYLRDLGQTFVVKRWGALEEWRTTPIPRSREWVWEDRADGALPPPTLSGFLGRYGFLIDIDSTIARDMDDAISSPGSFFARDQYGVMIVMPAKNRIAYAYRN